MSPMMRVGLTGGVGSGKSEVSRRMADRGAVVIDADLLAREVVAPGTAGLDEVVAAFGSQVLAADGALDRPKLAQIIFADPDRRATLNSIVHPRVARRTEELVTAAEPNDVVVEDVPLLVENSLEQRYDVVVVIDVAEQTQIERIMRDRGETEEQAWARVRAQAGRQQRRAVADIVIDNSGTLADLDAQLAQVWVELSSR